MIYINEWLDNQKFIEDVNFKTFLKYCEMESKLLLNNSSYIYNSEKAFKNKYCNKQVSYSIISDCFKFNQNITYKIEENVDWRLLFKKFIEDVQLPEFHEIYLFNSKKYELNNWKLRIKGSTKLSINFE